MSASPTPKEIARQWFEQVWIQRDTTAIRRLLAPNAVGHLEGGITIKGPEDFERFHRDLCTLLPDITLRIDDILADDTRACVRWEAAGNHLGHALGFKASGRSVTFRGITWMEIQDGKIVNGWDAWDYGSLANKLAVV